jgi:hypothetical protein
LAAIYLGHQLPGISSDQTRGVGGQPHPPPIWSCSGWGLPSEPVSRPLVRSYRTVAPLPHTGSLSLDVGSWKNTLMPIKCIGFHALPTSYLQHLTSSRRRYIFCGTGLRVTPTGRYPAPCPAELGLSSRTALRSCSRDCPAYSGYTRLLGSKYNTP